MSNLIKVYRSTEVLISWHNKSTMIIYILILILLNLSCNSKNHELDKSEKPQYQSSIKCEIPNIKVPLRWNFDIIYYDNNYLIGSRDYGRSEHPWGNTVPGFFVHSKKYNSWLKINQISTKNGKFGLGLNSLEEEDRVKMMIYPVDMGQEGLKNKNYCDLPLRTSGSIAFPQLIIYNKNTDIYRLEFFNSTNIEAVKTILEFKKSDLDLEFDERYRK